MLNIVSLSFLVGVALVFLGLVILLFYVFLKRGKDTSSNRETKTEGGIFVLIGPIPIVISSNRMLGYILLIVGILIVIGIILLTWLISF